MLMAYHKLAPLSVLALVALGTASFAQASGADTVHCAATRQIGDTVGIVADRKTGVTEQSLVEARLAVIDRERVLGTVYVDDQGLRYVELKRGAVVPGLNGVRGDGKVHPLPIAQIFGGEARLRACRPDSE